MLDLQDADLPVSLDFEADTIVTHAEPGVTGVLESLHIAFTGVAVARKGVQDLERLCAIDLT